MVNLQVAEGLFIAKNPDELKLLAPKLIDFAGDDNIWLFEGEMGAGKTSLIQAICQSFGVVDQVTSPTYSLVQEYQASNGDTIYHFDFYRLNHLHEAVEIGCEEYFDSGNLCFLEWPGLVAPLIPAKNVLITIEVQEDGFRTIKIARND
ncbi:MAG: tRNA (adenosine(37)-N6)-threonylcarbamoyltransferase complex ATPase subunit type 1 TsaE [Cyclobacteriaceae bacterium]|nr:MAG: tRNA (adenosine(37)-N6)-threonylcarbamoyltransferase complex ATPase subunit type 1 TsaE [Cyclobacteriaceae bacterium]